MTTTAAHFRPERAQRVRAAGPPGADRSADPARPTAAPPGRRPGSTRRGRRRAIRRRRGSRDPSMRSCVRAVARRPESSIRVRRRPADRRRLRASRRRAYHRRDDPSARPARRRLPAVAERQAPRGTLTHGRRLLQRLRSRRARRRHRRLHRRLPRRPARASRSPSSTRTRSAARASTAAASRPRRCSNRRPSPSAIRHAKDYGIDPAGRAGRRLRRDGRAPRRGREADVDRAQDASSTRTRSPGSRAAAASTARQGPRQPARRGRDAGRRRRARPAGHRRDPRHRLAGEVAARASTPDGKRIVTSDDVLRMDTLPKDIIIVGAGAVGVEFASMFHDLGVKVTLLEYLPGIVPLEDGEVSKALERSFTKRGIDGHDQRPLRRGGGQDRQDRRAVDRRPGGQGRRASSAPSCCSSRPAAPPTSRTSASRRRRSRPTAAFIKVDGHMRTQGAARLRDRRHRRRAVARPHGGARGDHRGAHDRRRRRRPRDGLRPAAARDLLPAGDRLDRADRGAVQGARAPSTRSARSRSRPSPRRSSAASTRASPRSSPTRETDDTLGVHIIGPHATDLIAEATPRVHARGDAVGDRRRDPRAPDAVRGHRRGRDGRRRRSINF